MTLGIFLEICFKICDRDVGMCLAALLLVNNQKMKIIANVSLD
jgi:hypothetical protein